ncbi:molecular chaperone [Acinetobacter modestus]|uniref:molecular chaperone n=1 Tax=Acinetobacter modestus TaxID=1776740 RepID=UPI003017E272
MTAWQRLGLEPTDNQREIKKAYAKQLKLIDQDQQPDDFIALRAAFEQAQYEAEHMAYEYDDSDDYFFENETSDVYLAQYHQTLSIEDQLNDSFLKIEQHISIYDINFNIRDELTQFDLLLQTCENSDLKNCYTDKIKDLLKKYDLEDFLTIFKDGETKENITPSIINQKYNDGTDQAELTSDHTEEVLAENTTSLIPTYLNEVTEALWNKDIDDITFDKFKYLLNQKFDIPLSQQIQIKDQLIAPLAEIDSSDLQPEYFRFLELWHDTYPDDANQYDQSYYSNLLQEKLTNYLSKRQLLEKLPQDQYLQLQELSGEKKFKPFKMLKLRRKLRKAYSKPTIDMVINEFHIQNSAQNQNYIFLKSLDNFKKLALISLIFIIGTFYFSEKMFNSTPYRETGFVTTFLFCLIFIFILQPIFQTKILGRDNHEEKLISYCKIWLLSGFIFCGFAPLLPEILHQVLTYGWLVCSIILLGSIQLNIETGINKLLQSVFITFDIWVINIGLTAISILLMTLFYLIGEPNYPWLVAYSLIPVSLLLLPESFRPLFYIFGYNKNHPELAEKKVFYKSIFVILFRLSWVFGFSFFLVSENFKFFMYASCIILASTIITGISTKTISSFIKYTTYIGLFFLTLYSIIGPIVIAYFLYCSLKAKKIITA